MPSSSSEQSPSWIQRLCATLRRFRLISDDSRIDCHVILKTFIWFLGMIFLTALTINDFIPLLEDYRNSNRATQVSVAIGDNEFKPPTIVVCIPFYKDEPRKGEDLLVVAEWLRNSTTQCAICETLAKYGLDVWKDLPGSVLSPDINQFGIYQTLSLAFFKRMVASGEHFLDSQYSSWNSVLFSSAINIFHWFNTNDYMFPVEFKGSEEYYLETLTDISRNKSGLESVLNSVLKSICAKMRYTEYNHNSEFDLVSIGTERTCEELVLNRSIPVLMDPGFGLFIQMPVMEKPQMKGYRFQLDADEFWNPNLNDSGANATSLSIDVQKSKLKYLNIYPDLSVMYVSDSDPVYSSYIYRTLLTRPRTNITLRYAVQTRAKDVRSKSTPCIYEDSITCFTKCTKLWMIEKCSCVPFTYARGLQTDPDLPYCSPSMYIGCNLTQGTKVPEETKQACMSKCKNSCEYTSYSWQITEEYSSTTGEGIDQFSNHSGSDVNVLMFPMFATFAEFAWTVKITPEQFVSQIGGIANFYLGFSGLSIFASIIVFVDFLRVACSKKKPPVEGSTDPSPNSRRETIVETIEDDTVSGWKWTTPIPSTSTNFWRPSAAGSKGDETLETTVDQLRKELKTEKDERKSEMFTLRNQIAELRSEIRWMMHQSGGGEGIRNRYSCSYPSCQCSCHSATCKSLCFLCRGVL